jgi:hypothetical protein
MFQSTPEVEKAIIYDLTPNKVYEVVADIILDDDDCSIEIIPQNMIIHAHISEG